MKRRSGFATSLACLIIFTPILIAGVALYASKSTFYQSDLSSSFEQQETTMMPTLMSEGVASSFLQVYQAVSSAPPQSCITPMNSSYAWSFTGSFSSSGTFDNQDITYFLKTVWFPSSVGPPDGDNDSVGGSSYAVNATVTTSSTASSIDTNSTLTTTSTNTTALSNATTTIALNYQVEVHVSMAGPLGGYPAYTDTQVHYVYILIVEPAWCLAPPTPNEGQPMIEVLPE